MKSAFARAAHAALALCVFAAAAHAADTSKPGAAKPAAAAAPKAAPRSAPVNVAADPGGAWVRYRAEGEFQRMLDAYQVLDAVELKPSGVDAKGCEQAKASLRASIEEVPVSLALRRADMLCAEALGDKAHAERAAAALGALSRHALADYGDGAWRRPIQVVQSWDVYALIHTLGYEFRYEYYQDLVPDRFFTHVVAAWDPDKQVERHLAFDYIDTMAAIDRTDPNFGFPSLRSVLADAFVESFAKGGDTMGLDALARSEALERDSPRARRDRLREGANAGGVQSAGLWLLLCAASDFDGCGDGLVDALLPLAERKHAMPMAQLALAYRNGIGVKKDPVTAGKLLDAADARWHRRGASTYYALLLWQLSDDVLPADGLQRLTLAAEAGNPDAKALLLMHRIIAAPGKPLSAQDVALLQAPENNGTGRGYAVLAEHYEGIDETAKAEALVRKAAEAGNASMQRRHAYDLLTQAQDAQGGAAARGTALMIDAAFGGDDYAMRYLARDVLAKGDYAAAMKWVITSARGGDLDSMLLVADIFAQEAPGVDGKMPEAIGIYQAIAEQNDYAPARRRLASLALQGRGMEKSPAKARAWLLKDAERGDAASQTRLGLHLLDGDFGKPDVREGRRWLEKALSGDIEDDGVIEAYYGYGTWLVGNGATASERARGIALLRKIEPEDANAANNLAWALCVSSFDDVRDPAAGLIVGLRMREDKLDPAGIDTVAACYAAVGDYARAVELQSEAIQQLRAGPDAESAEFAGIYTRLDLYKAGKPYRQPKP